MPMLLPKPVISRPRPAAYLAAAAEVGPGGEGGNASARLAATIGARGLFAVAFLLSAVLVVLTTVVLSR